MIDQSQLSASKPDFKYDTSQLVDDGYRFKAAYDFENPNFVEEIQGLEVSNIEYKILNGNGRQKDIWVKSADFMLE